MNKRTRWLRLTLTILAMWSPGAAPAAAEEPSLSELIEKVGAAYGGTEELLAASGYRARGKILSVSEGLSGTVRVSVSLEGMMRVEIRYPHRNEVRILSGGLAWNGGERKQAPSKAAMAASIQFQYHRLAAPFELVAAAPEDLERVGSSEEGWAIVRRDWSEMLRTEYEIAPETGVIHRIRGEVGTSGDPLHFTTESSDLRTVEGVVFPFRTTTFVGRAIAAETILDRVNVVEEFPDGSFLPTQVGSDL